MPVVSVLLRIRRELGRNLTSDEHSFMYARFKDGVPQEQVQTLVEQFKNPMTNEQPVRAAGGLRAV